MNTTPGRTPEKILGLDPRELLAQAGTPWAAKARGTWQPPGVEELAPLLPAFVVEAFIGRGGMGAVYRARQPSLDRVVALKLLPSPAAEDAEFAGRFRTEARALAKLQHPHIVTIYESGETADGQLYYVMEYMDGSDLAERLARGTLPAAQALGIARAVCEALEYAHARGIIHRDIKPANVLLGANGSLKVADFGLAKEFTAEGPPGAEVTMTGTALGTPSYMSPEQRAGRAVDARADLYSMGVMLYEMLTGELPQGAWQPPSRRSDSSPRLDAVVEKTLQPDPTLRVQSAAELRAQLERIERTMAPGARRRRVLLTAAAGLALASGGVGLWHLGQVLPVPSIATPEPAEPLPSAPRETPLTPPGLLKPLEGLDLRDAAMTGHWHWLDDKPGGTLAITYTHEQPRLKILHLPVRPGTSGYDLKCDVFLEHRGGHLVFLLPAGQARTALVLDLYDHSGLECIRDADWKSNETTLARLLPWQRLLPMAVTVRPQGERVAITVQLEGKPFIEWEGQQSDLSLPKEHYPPAMVNHRGPVLALQSLYGAAAVRALEVNILPEP